MAEKKENSTAEKKEIKSSKQVTQSRLDIILEKGVIQIGTFGDYKPFTYLNPSMKQFEGFDIDAANLLAKDLGVKVEFVQTSWPTLIKDLQDDKFDIAMGGITRNFERQKIGHLSPAYFSDGKIPLIRDEDKDRFKSLEDINQPSVRIGVNPGGTNEQFVRANLSNAEITVVQNNLDVPKMVAEGKVDVMITDSVEARNYEKSDSRLYAALKDQPFAIFNLGYLMHRDDLAFQNWVQLWVEEHKLQGTFKDLEKKWIDD
ncbi:transporter substrate-binding domain-containing protein [Bacillus sp. 03113]|uniref:transporter substrate-binding domain-containing protein n=1 Tax=Bacillus sp. 03113 TaxID=2578211 RepID=UPI00215B8948|nr:transporter substrate-binding domain-containing protein [Bacillus sp. 03113]